jgi:hypothetical protein
MGIQDSILKIPNAKRVGGVVQVVEHLPNKCEAKLNPWYNKTNKNPSVIFGG